MQVQTHDISLDSSSVRSQLTSFHYGRAGSGKKVYIQASLHADEVPPMLVAQFLRRELTRLEERIRGEIILVPAANPLGLAQAIQGSPFGRFDLTTGTNFNRAYKHVAEDLKTSLRGQLGADANANVAIVREHARTSVASWEVCNDAEALKKQLLTMAIDADIVLDLHCDNEAVIHIYTGTPLADQIMPLASLLGAHAVLTARVGGGEPFDEACSRLWWDLAAHFGPDTPVPDNGCLSTTVELRGEMDVRYDLAEQDARALIQFLARAGAIDLDPAELTPLPAPLCQPTPLEGVQPVSAPHSGVLVMLRKLGEQVKAGETIADLINPVSGETTALKARADGVLFASTAHRHLLRGMAVAKIAGATAYRSGNLLSE
jgi:predicted deacylase